MLAYWSANNWDVVLKDIVELVVAVTALIAGIVAYLKSREAKNAAIDAKSSATAAQGTAAAAQDMANKADKTAGNVDTKAELLTIGHQRNADDIRQLSSDQTMLANQLPSPNGAASEKPATEATAKKIDADILKIGKP